MTSTTGPGKEPERAPRVRDGLLRALEMTLWVTGLVVLFGTAYVAWQGARFEAAAREEFRTSLRQEDGVKRVAAATAADASATIATTSAAADTTVASTVEPADVASIAGKALALNRPSVRAVDDWSATRSAHYQESLERPAKSVAVLSIPALDLEVLVLNGTSEWALNRGVGLIEGSSQPGEAGTVGIAGHRDGFFRTLGELEPGHELTLETRAGAIRYVVDRTEIVKPQDVHVLNPTPEPSLTLVTCYPFYFVGPAPLRYIVHARADVGT